MFLRASYVLMAKLNKTRDPEILQGFQDLSLPNRIRNKPRSEVMGAGERGLWETVQKIVDIAALRHLFLASPACKVGPCLASGNLDFRSFPTIP